ncbi:hypothetical protein FOXYSP1_08822 [Fusarium oxysporum f. sp. phaseoli]
MPYHILIMVLGLCLDCICICICVFSPRRRCTDLEMADRGHRAQAVLSGSLVVYLVPVSLYLYCYLCFNQSLTHCWLLLIPAPMQWTSPFLSF